MQISHIVLSNHTLDYYMKEIFIFDIIFNSIADKGYDPPPFEPLWLHLTVDY